MTEGIRLQKVLAQAGVASRRRCEELMVSGRVEVDGDVNLRMGMRVDPATAVIRVDGKRLPPPSEHAYLVLNKPRGVVSTMADEQGRPDLGQYVEGREDRLFHVGRLDTETSGLLILTNDGDLAHKLAHPSFEIAKTYVALVDGFVKDSLGMTLKAG
ncbi:MAG TPA: pseudouridine synthase, partial [Aeromicrobium sp.]|nr:pseudouridine synthase [Aeromicrobium sp.]